MTSRTLAAFLTAAAFCLCVSARATAADKPNILLIISDDQGYLDLAAAGNEKIKTPALDRLAREGVRLTSFYVAWPACTPSRGAVWTGRYPQRNGTYDMYRNEAPDYGHKYSASQYAATFERIGGMDEREILIPRVLKDAGYTSGLYGKWDLGMHRRFLPLQRGWDDYYGFVNTGIDYWTHERYGVPSMYRNNEPTEADKGQYSTHLFHREAERFLSQHHDKPFFLTVTHNAPHGASNLDKSGLKPPQKYVEMYPPAQNDREKKLNEYMATVTAMDESIGKLLDLLDKHKLADNTLVFFMADNGGSGGADNGPLRGRKSTMWEGGVRVLSLARWPGKLPAGSVNNEFLTTLEIFPTLCSITGAKPPEGVVLDGFDMIPILRGDRHSPRDEMFWERRGDKAARVGKWKWVAHEKPQGSQHSAAGGGLFDLSTDIGEQKDLATERPEVLKMVKDRFAAWKQAMDDAEPRGPFRDY